MTKTVLLKSQSKIDRYVFEVDFDNKTFSIGYAKNLDEHYTRAKITLKAFYDYIRRLKLNGFKLLEKRWI